MLRRLLERLKQGVKRLAREHVDFVDDVDLESGAARPDVDVLAQLANFVDPAIAGAVDFQDIDIVAGADARADVTLVARRWRRPGQAVQRLRQNAGGRRLADATGAGE